MSLRHNKQRANLMNNSKTEPYPQVNDPPISSPFSQWNIKPLGSSRFCWRSWVSRSDLKWMKYSINRRQLSKREGGYLIWEMRFYYIFERFSANKIKTVNLRRTYLTSNSCGLDGQNQAELTQRAAPMLSGATEPHKILLMAAIFKDLFAMKVKDDLFCDMFPSWNTC